MAQLSSPNVGEVPSEARRRGEERRLQVRRLRATHDANGDSQINQSALTLGPHTRDQDVDETFGGPFTFGSKAMLATPASARWLEQEI
jgi:hypothetical protein